MFIGVLHTVLLITSLLQLALLRAQYSEVNPARVHDAAAFPAQSLSLALQGVVVQG
jgi:hypothetical protein